MAGDTALCQLHAPRLVASLPTTSRGNFHYYHPIWQPRENRLRQVKPLSRSHMAPRHEARIGTQGSLVPTFLPHAHEDGKARYQKSGMRGSCWTRGNRMGRGVSGAPSLLFPSTQLQGARQLESHPPCPTRPVFCLLFGHSFFCLTSTASFHPSQAPGSHLM